MRYFIVLTFFFSLSGCGDHQTSLQGSFKSAHWIETGSEEVYLRVNAKTSLSDLQNRSGKCRLEKFSLYNISRVPTRFHKFLKIRLINPPQDCQFGGINDTYPGFVYIPRLKGNSYNNLARYYEANYQSIKTDARKFWPNSYACAAFASTALKRYGFDVKQVLVTNEIEEQILRLGFTTISDLAQLLPGDLVFTTKSTSNIPGTYSHVFVFNGYAGSQSKAFAIDNYKSRYVRNIDGNGGYSQAVIAYRPPS